MGLYKDHDTRLKEAEQCVRNILDHYGIKVENCAIVGSSYITDKRDSDVDVLVLANQSFDVDAMGFEGWAYGGSVGEGSESTWGSWKKTLGHLGEVNMLITTRKEYFQAWLTSAEVCRYLHLQGVQVDRKQRVSIHNIIMDDSTADYECM